MTAMKLSMKKKWIIVPMVMCLCSCTPTTTTETSRSDNDPAHMSSSTASDSIEARIQALNEEMQEYIDEYDTRHDAATLERAIALNDSIERIDTTQQGRFYNTLMRSQLLAKAGRVKESLRLQESLLSKNPNDLARLQFYAGKYWIEEQTDSMHHYAQRALEVCDTELGKKDMSLEEREQMLENKLSVYYLLNDRNGARMVCEQMQSLQRLAGAQPLTEQEFNNEFNDAREELNRLAVAWRNDNDVKAETADKTTSHETAKHAETHDKHK